MKRKYITLTIVILALLVVCAGAGYYLDLLSPLQARMQLRSLNSVAAQIPLPSGAMLLDSKETPHSSDIPGCWVVSIERLYGTNDLTFDQVLSFYDRSLDRTQWQQNIIDAQGRTYSRSQQLLLTISDDYRFAVFRHVKLEDVQQQFKTLFYFNLTQRLDPSKPVTACT